MQYVDKKFKDLITICQFKIMFIKICCPIKITLWGGGAMAKDLSPQCGGERSLSPHTCNLGYFDLGGFR